MQKLYLMCPQPRNVLGTPVHKIFHRSSKALETRDGAEYIIMEKVPGAELESIWPSMRIEERFTAVKVIASFLKGWTPIKFK